MDLPDELLDEVLRLVPPRHLAACRRVCKSWRGIIDGCGLVLAHLAPGPVRGIFVNLFDKATHSFFSRSGAAWPPIDGSLRFLPGHSPSKGESHVEDHRNGLLLLFTLSPPRRAAAMYVCNPATRRWAPLPFPPQVSGAPAPMNFGRPFLVFDPAVSLHYLAMCFPGVPARPAPPSPPATGDRKKRPRRDRSHVVVSNFSEEDYPEDLPPSLIAKYEEEVDKVGSMGWPPHSYAVQVFSSRTGRWEERRFVRQGDVVATVSDMWSMNPYAPGHGRVLARVLWGYAAVYWQGAFYLTYRGAFIIRFSLLDDMYQVIKTTQLVDTFLGGPRSYTNEYGKHVIPYVYLGKSKQGVYYTALHGYQLQIWVLHGVSEPCQTPEWELKHQADLKPYFSRHYKEIGKSWILDPDDQGSNEGGDHGWDSSDDCAIDAKGGTCSDDNEGSTEFRRGLDLLGYHPYKEIAFLGNRYDAFAYYLESSRLRCLGSVYPTGLRLHAYMEQRVSSHIYTPCMDDLLPAHNDQW